MTPKFGGSTCRSDLTVGLHCFVGLLAYMIYSEAAQIS